MKLNSKYLHPLFFIVFLFTTFVSAQVKAGNYYIVNAENNLVWDLDAKCTNDTRECPAVLSAKSGKPSQNWRIAPHDGFISIINVSLDRIVSASTDYVQMNNYFPTNTNNFKAVANADGSFILYQGGFDENENLFPTTKTLQPNGANLHLAEKNNLPDKKQSWLFMPFETSSVDFNSGNKSANDSAKVQELLQQEKDLKAKNDFDGAIKLMEQAVQIDSNNDSVYVEMAGAYYSKKDYANATKFAEKSKTINPKNGLAWNLLGLIAKDQNDCENAILDFTKVVELLSGANYTITNRGYCYQTLKKHEEAIADFTKAIEMDANYDSAYWGRAVSYGELNKHDESIGDYTKYLTFKPNAAAFNNRGYQYYLLKKYDEAIADYRRSLEVDPNYGYAKGNLEWLLKNRPADSSNAATANSNNNIKTAEDAYKLGVEAYGKRDFDSTIAYFTKTIELDPKYVLAYKNRAMIYDQIKHEPEKARPDYKKVIELDPNDFDAYLILGVIDKDLGYRDEAIEVYTKLLPMLQGKTTAENISVFYTFRGGLYSDKGNYDSASADFTKAIELDGKNSLAYDGLGTVFSRQRDYEKAIANFNKAIELTPNLDAAYNNRGLAYFYKGNYSNAMNDLNKAIELNPKLSAAYNNRAAVYDVQNKPELEIADYKKAVELDPKNAAAKANLEIAQSVLGDGTNTNTDSDVRFINAALNAAQRAFKNGAGLPQPQACQNLFNSYLGLNGAQQRLESLQNGIRYGSISTPKVQNGQSLDGFANDLQNAKNTVTDTADRYKCDFLRVIR